MKLFLTHDCPIVCFEGNHFSFRGETIDELLSRENLRGHLLSVIEAGAALPVDAPTHPLAPIGNQEVWAAGVTYMRSREARMEESKSAGGGDFYDRVYEAPRPELFFKAAGRRAVGTKTEVRIRKDAKWSVPEPELTLVISPEGRIQGYTIGNDMSSRDIEGENPLYLPQAKSYDGSCALGPCIYLTNEPLASTTEISIEITRGGSAVFGDKVEISRIKRSFEELVEFLYRELSFPVGAFLMTGTGVVPPDTFTLEVGDVVSIAIPPIGVLTNTVA
jgi:2-dehydro-3-deoxy-D-arabinonate dehydratase